MKTLSASLLALALIVPSLALADNAQVCKWIDANGVIHYSDRPPADGSLVETLDLPALPPQDPTEIAARQALVVSQLAALQQAAQADALQQRTADMARQQAELQAELDTLRAAAQSSTPPAAPLITASPFVPASYRVNLYRFHGRPDRDDRDDHHRDRPPVSLLRAPRGP